MTLDEQRACGAIVTGWKRPLLLTHTKPDGDALGCLLAMRSVLRRLKADPLAVAFEPPAPRYAALVEDDPLVVWDGGKEDPTHLGEVDGVLVMDTCAYSQLEPLSDWLRSRREAQPSVPLLVVDHHVTRDDLADHYLIDETASSASVIVYEWASACGWELDATALRALFVGVATDTGWFRHSNTDARTLEIAAALVRRGVDVHDEYTHLYQSELLPRMRLFGAALDAMELHHDNRLAIIPITSAMFARTGSTPADTEELVNEPLRVATVEVSVLLVETPESDPTGTAEIKASFRAKGDTDVAAIAARFGGGGHVKAAGARIPGSLDDAKNKILAAFRGG